MFEVKEPSLEKKIDDLVKRTVDFMMSLQFTSGNCPMAMCWEAKKLKHPGDKIVRWSQGAPGWIYICSGTTVHYYGNEIILVQCLATAVVVYKCVLHRIDKKNIVCSI